jgi:hypothetical protein
MVTHARPVASSDGSGLVTLNPLRQNCATIGRFSHQNMAGDILNRSAFFYKWRYFIIFKSSQ